MTLSIIVHNRNRASALDQCMKSIGEQAHRPLELIVLDAGSTDGSSTVIAERAAQLKSRGIAVRSYECPVMGVAASRNLGATKSSGGLLCFLDNDAQFVDEGATTRAVQQFLNHERLGVLSFRVFKGDSPEPDRTAWVFRRPLSDWFARSFETFTFAGTAFCVRPEAFWSCGGFWDHLEYSREEEDLAMALIDRGWQIQYSANVSIRHYSDPRGRSSMARRRYVELRNGVLVMWRRLPVVLAVPAIGARIVSMLARAIFRERQPTTGLLRALPDAVHEWKSFRLRRAPIRLQSALRYARLHQF